MTKFEIHEWARRGKTLLDRVTKAVAGAPSEKIRELKPRLPSAIAGHEGPVRIAFSGQYSAGKSSILKALTGRQDIEVGADITTKVAHPYDWNGINVIDTPGVHTELRPDHDATTYETISGADLLVFVVTNELFDSHVAEHFRKLAVERDKAPEMMLVVNKMQRCAGGNTAAVQKVLGEDLKKVLVPFTPEQLRTSFIDAEAILKAQQEADAEVRSILERRSNFGAFVGGLNDFVRKRGLAGKYTTALYTMEQVLQETVAAESKGDKDVDALEELLLRQRRVLADARAQLSRSVAHKVRQTTSAIREEGREVADRIHGADQQEINRDLKDAQARVDRKTEELKEVVAQLLRENMTELAARVDGIAESELANEVLPRLEERLKVDDSARDVLSGKSVRAGEVIDMTRQFGEFLVRNSLNPDVAGSGISGLFKLTQYAGTGAHNLVKDVGHFFRKSFKPWEAVKWTRGIATAGRVLSIVGTVLTVVLQFKADADAGRHERALREARSDVRSSFGEAANAVEMHFDEATDTYVSERVGQPLGEVDEKLEELRKMARSRGRMFQDLEQLLNETKTLIREIHGAKP